MNVSVFSGVKFIAAKTVAEKKKKKNKIERRNEHCMNIGSHCKSYKRTKYTIHELKSYSFDIMSCFLSFSFSLFLFFPSQYVDVYVYVGYNCIALHSVRYVCMCSYATRLRFICSFASCRTSTFHKMSFIRVQWTISFET